jgi:hypothetical protein
MKAALYDVDLEQVTVARRQVDGDALTGYKVESCIDSLPAAYNPPSLDRGSSLGL